MLKPWLPPLIAISLIGASLLGPIPMANTHSIDGLENRSVEKNQLQDDINLTRVFDLSPLPPVPRQAPPAPPPRDPALAITSTQLIGTITADDIVILLASDAGTFHRLRVGDSYKGFTLTEVSASSATFSEGETQIVRPVNQASNEAVR